MGYRALSKYRAELMGLAMLWVMAFHAFELDLGREWLNNLRAVGFGGVDIFILLSSMGLVMSLERREREYGAFMRRRAARILPAYYAVMLPYTVYLIVHDGVASTALLWNSTLLYYWVQCRGAFNWYVAGAMTFYAVTPMCWRFLRQRRHWGAWVFLGCVLGLAVCQWLMQVGYWQYLDVFYRVPVFFVGLLIGLYCAEDRRLTVKAPCSGRCASRSAVPMCRSSAGASTPRRCMSCSATHFCSPPCRCVSPAVGSLRSCRWDGCAAPCGWWGRTALRSIF